MADSFVATSQSGFGSNLFKSVAGVFFGIALFFGSFAVLWVNEGRIDLSLLAQKAISIDSMKPAPGSEGTFVSTTGLIKLEEDVGDPKFLKPGAYLSLERHVEMFAWVEKVETKEEKQLGGSTKTIKTYNYVKEWTSSPKDSSRFEYPEGHKNPPLPVKEARFKAKKASIGIYDFSPQEAALPLEGPLSLTKEQLIASEEEYTLEEETYLFHGEGTFSSPLVGDIRIYYTAFSPIGSYTLFGQLSGNEIRSYYDTKEDTSLYRLFRGSRDEAISTLATEHKIMTWVLRLVGFLMMWIGLTLILGPIQVVMDIIPFLGSAGRLLMGIALLPIALVLSGITILISLVAHQVVILIFVLVGLTGLFVWRYIVAKRKKRTL